MKYDAIIVGSGIAGMTAAGLLALENRKVLILEQHNIFGGLLQNFRRDRLTFPTGVHSIGSLSENQVLWRYFEYLGVLDRISFVEMDRDGFQEFVFEDTTYEMPTGHKEYAERLMSYFPDERQAIDTFMSDMKICMDRSPYYQIDPERVFARLPMDTMSLQDYLDALTTNLELRCLLAACYPLYGIDPIQCPLVTHFSVLDSFLNSSYRVDEREKAISKAFTFRLKELGVEMRRSTTVDEIICEGRIAKGVRLDDGEVIHGDLVMYSGHPKELVTLCPKLRPAFKWRVAELDNTDPFFSVGLSWSHDVCSSSTKDVFIFDTNDLKKAAQPWKVDTQEVPGILYVAGLPRPERGRYSVVAIAAAYHEDWEKWDSTPTGDRGNEYAEKKLACSEKILRRVRQQWPEAASSIELIDSNTPLTLRDYTLSPFGTGYGVKKTVEKMGMSQIGTMTSVKGLFMIGQSSQLPGIVGTVISSVVACSNIFGADYMLSKIARATS